MQKLNIKHFRSPRAVCTPGYFWIMNAPMEQKVLFAQLEDFRAHGARSVCLHPSPQNWAKYTTMSPDYLTDEYMDIIGKIVKECARLDMCFYLYDEGGYPSGSAAGQVFLSDPHRFALQYWTLTEDGKNVVFHREETPKPCGFPNLLTPGATEKFLELTHEKFRKKVGRFFHKNIFYTFTDEPTIPRFLLTGGLSWCDDFSDVFKRRKGYRIEPFLADILQDKNTKDKKRLQHRVDYFDIQSQLFVERFFLPIRNWARKNHLLSGGHLSGENSTEGNHYFSFGHILRTLRAMDFPGVDVIWRQIYPKTKPLTPDHKAVPRKFDPIRTGAKSHPFTKYASSVAHQAGKTAVLSETFAVYGFGLKPDIMRFLTDYQLLRGATRFVISNVPLEIKGANMIGCHPYFGPANPLWDYFDLYHAYTARLCEVMSAGSPDIHVAFYHDIRAIWCGGDVMKEAISQHEWTAEELLRRQCDFDFIDDDLLRRARLADGKLHIGKMAYDTVVIPHTDWMTPQAKKRLDDFRALGGKILYPEEIGQIEPVIGVKPASSDIRATRRQLGNGEVLYFITSESPEEIRRDILIRESGDLLLLDGETGRTLRIKRSGRALLNWTFAPYHSLLLLANSQRQADADFKPFTPGPSLRLDQGWTIQPLKRYFVGLKTFECDDTPGAPVPAKLGDWRPYLGQEFSGEACYHLEFEAQPGKGARLSLGKVNYCCTVLLNGQILGRRFWGPFDFEVPQHLLRKHNTLEIKVTNTFANAVCSESAYALWKKHYPEAFQTASYLPIVKQFEPDSFPSGLFGPVKLTYSK